MSADDILIRPDAGWSLTLYPTAGEAGGSFVPSLRPRRSGWVPGAPAADPERSRLEAGRRARAKVRRYCAAHRLNRLGTLTYAGEGCHDPALLRVHVGLFFRALRRYLDVGSFAYLWVPEWHKTGHGLHVHFAVGRYIPRGVIKAAWPHGHVHIKALGDVGVGSTSLQAGRRAAGYLSKYVTKNFEDTASERSMGLHRYEVAQGFTPPAIRLTDVSAEGALEQASMAMGGVLPSMTWFSADVEGWRAPPALWAAWDSAI